MFLHFFQIIVQKVFGNFFTILTWLLINYKMMDLLESLKSQFARSERLDFGPFGEIYYESVKFFSIFGM